MLGVSHVHFLKQKEGILNTENKFIQMAIIYIQKHTMQHIQQCVKFHLKLDNYFNVVKCVIVDYQKGLIKVLKKYIYLFMDVNNCCLEKIVLCI